MFDTIAGLPVHALVVHAVIVGLPVMAVLTVLAAARPGWRPRLPLVVAGDAAVVVLALVARQSGQQLQARLAQFAGPDIASTHGRAGTWVWAFATALLAAAALAWWAHRRARWSTAALVVVALVAVASVGWTIVVGDSGARAVWEQTIDNTTAP